MNSDTKPVVFAVNGHPEEDQLLLGLEGELSAEDAANIDKHLGTCWNCRARSEEMHRGILAFVEYREKRYLPSLAPPPDNISTFRGRLRQVILEKPPVEFSGRTWRSVIGRFRLPVQMRWATAVAVAMTLVIFWVQVVNPPAISASELLTRATAAQNPSGATAIGGLRRVAHQKVRIRKGSQVVVRDFEWKLGTSIAAMQWSNQADPMLWNSPLTAEGFANWRNSLQEKTDKVKRAANLLTLETTRVDNPGGGIAEASIVVRAGDFHPLEQRLRFADHEELEITEVAFQIDEVPASNPIAQYQPPAPAKVQQTDAVPSPVDLDDAELQLRYTLFKYEWDLGEDLTISRIDGQVVLSGTVSSREREEAMRSTFGTMPNIRLAIDPPSASNVPNHSGTKESASSTAPLLGGSLEKAFSSREERLAFVDRCLADSDTALSHAWALKKLVDRYNESEEKLLKPEADARLREMLRAHLQETSRANRGLARLLELLSSSSAATTQPLPAEWRTRILALFTSVQLQDRLVANLVVGSQSNGPNLATASRELRAAHQKIGALISGLGDLSGEPVPR